MVPSEIAFLALGLLLGSAVGAAIAQQLARRQGPRREVRVTITPNAIPSRRAYTLAVPGGISLAGPRRGPFDAGAYGDGSPMAFTGPYGPEMALDAAGIVEDEMGGPGPSRTRTRVPSAPAGIPATAVAVPVVTIVAAEAVPGAAASSPSQWDDPGEGIAEVTEARLASVVAAPAAIAVLDPPVEDEGPPEPERPIVPPGALPALKTLVRPRPPVEPTRPVLSAGAVAVPVLRPIAMVGGTGDPGGAGGGTGGQAAATDACAPARRLVEERCALADVAREQARSAADALREAQRIYDVLRERVDRAQATADPRQVAAAKERLHADFRVASDRAGGSEETEAAARAWLQHINELNAAVREAQRILDAGNAELRAQVPVLDRLAAEADAARIAGENAESGCRDARVELADCEEAQARAAAAVPPVPEEPHPFEGVWPAEQPGLPDREAPGDLLAGLPVIVRVLRGDRDARNRLDAALAAGEPDAERDWQLRVSRLVDAIVARAIEDGYLDVPEDDPFWRLFEPREARDIVGALSALGYRYDGMGGFADGRVPAARDLSLAVGYAGLDRMRIRTWPRESEISLLYERAMVAADEWLADQGGDLSLGRMVDALGNRAAELADVWNAWGRVRPALLES